MSSRWFTRVVLGTVAGVLLSSAAALADPSDRVARISFIGGAASFRPASLDEWSQASLNYPLTVGDHVWTDRDARIELQLGAIVVRIAPLTEFSLLNLDDHTAQLRVTQGAVSVRVRALRDDDVLEIDTPNSAVSVLHPGLYRVDVNEAGDASTVTVREGDADVAAGPSAFPLRRDQAAVLTGLDGPQTSMRGVDAMDDFDDWGLTRDRLAESPQSARYVSPEMIGYEDLDANGTWEAVGEYGPVWRPRVQAGWVPYRFGHWAWVEPWGWTWIDDASWGFAPFHYGRWAFLPARGWGWVPGTIVARPVYAPALVAFVGGSNWSVSARLGTGPVAWFPLGPREAYVPAYQVTPAYVQRVNAAHVTNGTATNPPYVNRAVPGAVTAVSHDAFVQARPVALAAVGITADQARMAPVVGMAAVAPQRVSIAGAAATTTRPPAAAVTRAVVVRRAPPPAAAPLVRRMVSPRAAPASQPVSVAPQAPTPARTPATPGVPANAPNRAAASQAAANLSARQTQERADIAARQARDRAALQAKHAQEQQTSQPSQRAQLQQRHAQEMKALQDQQKEERDALQKRQQAERQGK